MVDLIKERIGEYSSITAQAWRDNDYYGVVTEDAQICVYRILEGVVLHQRFDSMLNSFIGLEFHDHGMVTVSKNGFFIFYEYGHGEE